MVWGSVPTFFQSSLLRRYQTQRETIVLANGIGDIAELNVELDQLDDPRQGFALVQSHIHAIRQAGQEVPDDLVRLSRNLQTDCILESQGR
jgi:hypothetical protein